MATIWRLVVSIEALSLLKSDKTGFRSSMVVPVKNQVVQVCVDGKDRSTENASVIFYVRGYYNYYSDQPIKR